MFRGDSGFLLISMRISEYGWVNVGMLTRKLSARADRHSNFDDVSQHSKVCQEQLVTAVHSAYNTCDYAEASFTNVGGSRHASHHHMETVLVPFREVFCISSATVTYGISLIMWQGWQLD